MGYSFSLYTTEQYQQLRDFVMTGCHVQFREAAGLI